MENRFTMKRHHQSIKSIKMAFRFSTACLAYLLHMFNYDKAMMAG